MTTLTTRPEAPATRAAPAHEPRHRARRARSTFPAGLSSPLQHGLLALLAYLPLLLVDRGVVTDDTKTYLYLNPGRFLSQVADMWNPNVALGTVTHETIGYLLPMGPFFWVGHVLGLPVWVTQRLWLGTILFLAGAGVLFLCRTLALRGPGVPVAALAFMLSPYFLQYAGRISVILLPWAGLPWMVGLVARALRRGGWRYPALFAVVVALVSGINASSVLYAGIAPVLWVIYATAVERQADWRRALGVVGKIALLSLLVSVWWIAGLQIEAAYGVNVLKFTETIPATSQTSTASEVLRGIGYWYFYGGDRDGPWTFSSVVYTEYVWVLVLSFLVPVLAFLSAVLVRWKHRAFFVALVVIGVILSVGAHPYATPTPTGSLLKAFMTRTTAGLAMRSTDRATPLVVLGLAMLLGAGVTALWRRISWAGLGIAVALGALVIANNPPLFNGDTVANGMTQPANLPSYQQQAIAHLNATHPGLRVLAIPGNDFATFKWGDTVDTPQVAYLNRPFAIQEQQVMGSMATADMLYGFDEPIQLGTEQWDSLAPMARLMSAGDVLVQNDIAYWQFGAPQPLLTAQQLRTVPPGLSNPVSYGAPVDDVPRFSTLDEADLAAPPNAAPPAPLVSYTVDHPRPIVRGESNQGALLVSGDDSGLENLATAGLLDTRSAIYFSGSLDRRPGQLHQLLGGGAQLVVTDTNRKQAFRWDALTANTGFTEERSQDVAHHDPSDSPLDLTPGAPMSSRTTATYLGAVDVTASSYGDQVSYLPENRAYMAVDGNPDTSWETGSFVPNPGGEWWQLRLQHPVTAGQVQLVQPLRGNLSRWITRVTLSFDGRRPVTVNLTHASRTSAGQVVSFKPRTFHTLRIRVDRTSNDHATTLTAGPIGFSTVSVPGVSVAEVIVMPTDLTGATGSGSLSHRLTYVMTRQRVSPFPVRADPETVISRQFDVPTARTFGLSGFASLSALLPDDALDSLTGHDNGSGNSVVAYSSGRTPGDLRSGASAAIDGNPATVWQPGFGASHQVGAWLQYHLPNSITFDHLALQVVADGRHSVPTSLEISTENGTRRVQLPAIPDSRVAGAVTSVPVNFPALSGSSIRVTVTGARLERSVNYYSPTPIALPLGIAELGIRGLSSSPDPARLPGTCRSDLLSIDGHAVPIRIVGTTAAARSNQEMAVQPCGADARGITLAAGHHVVETATGHAAGWDLDQLVLDSAPGGAALVPSSPSTLPATSAGPAPNVKVLDQHATSSRVDVTGATQPFELVLGQSINGGWHAVASPGPHARAGSHPVDLGTPQLVDGFANGWPVTAGELAALGGSGFTVNLTWTPQSREWVALAVSGVALLACLVVGVLPERFRQRFWRRGVALWRSGRDALGRWIGGRRRTSASRIAGSIEPPAAEVPAGAVAGPVTDPVVEPPELAAPWSSGGHRPPLWAVPLIAGLTGVLAWLVSYPLVGVAAALAVGAALVIRPARLVLAVAPVALLIAAAVTVVSGQIEHHLTESSNWPASYEGAGVLALMAVVLLGCDAVVEVTRAVARRAAMRGNVPDGAAAAGDVPGATGGDGTGGLPARTGNGAGGISGGPGAPRRRAHRGWLGPWRPS